MNPQDLIKNQNILTRFASEFDMMNEMIQFQKGVNQVILTVNNFLGEETPQNVDRIPENDPDSTDNDEYSDVDGSSDDSETEDENDFNADDLDYD